MPPAADGTPEGTRTPDPLLRRQLLYPPELQAHIVQALFNEAAASPIFRRQLYTKQPAFTRATGTYGAGDGNRTHATSLEGWDSTIELHPQEYASANVSLDMIA